MKQSPLDRWLTTDPHDKEQEEYEALERERMRTYELEKVETYSIRARNVDEAMEILNGLDNSAAYQVSVRVIYASAPTEKEETNA